MIVAIIAGGEKSRFRRIDEADFIIACDKGAQYAAEEGDVPDLTAGDFDSVPKGFRPAGETAVLPTEKNDTDTMFAVRKALSRGCDQIYLYCAEGGRPDHFLGNIQAALFAAEKGVRTTVFGNRADIIVFGKGTFCAEKRDGCALSVLSLTDKSEGVTVSGVKYPLQNAVLTSDFPLGISNEWTAPQALIEVKKGVLAVIISSLQSENK